MKRSDGMRTSGHARRLNLLRRQITRLDHCLARLEEQSSRLVRWRLLSFALLFVAGAAVLLSAGPVPWVIISLILLSLFIFLVYRHRRIESSAAKIRIWRQLREDQAARMALDWERMPATQPVDESLDHPFGRDLDVVGDRSLQRVIDLAYTAEGSDLLRRWLMEFEPDLRQLPARQALVRELVRLPLLVPRLSLNALLAAGLDGTHMPVRWSSATLLNWLQLRADRERLRLVFFVLLALAPVNILLLLAFLQGWLPPFFLLSWFFYGAIAASQLRAVEPLFRDASAIAESLRQLEAVFDHLVRRSFDRSPGLQALTAPLRAQDQGPGALLARTNRLLGLAGLRYNPVVALLLNALFPLDLLVALLLDSLKLELVELLPGWLSTWQELEALGSLANMANLYPQASFAQVATATATGDVFVASGMGHPLIPATERVLNDLAIGELGDVLLITGSNMAGKSTFLRTIGLNLRLAMCGAPVLAAELKTHPFRVFASITVTDSLTDGFSFFYAEVRRLKALLSHLQEAPATPLFFLIDEIFRGTNNRERLIGSRAYVSSLAGGNGCGAIATHDLELVSLAQGAPQVRNYHFRDDVRDGRMVFDYKLYPGPCPTTNALRIMRLAGLPVQQPEEQG